MDGFFVNQQSNTAVCIGGVRVLQDASTEQITVAVRGAVITVMGDKLKIARFDENEIEITGKIENVETMGSRKRAL